MEENEAQSSIVFYEPTEGTFRVEVHLEDETVWLSQALMSELFGVKDNTITYHIQEIYADNELKKEATTRKIRVVRKEGSRDVSRAIDYYNLDMIIAVGYRVNSKRATQFRIWATSILKSFIVKGFALDDERMKTGRNMTYFDELQERIREIRLSERVFYPKVKDIYETSVDYDPKSSETDKFFKIVQNKLLWAISQKTAAELVAHRANAELPFMGMTAYPKDNPKRITQKEASVAKNYLTETEMKSLGLLVEQYLAFAESQALQRIAMSMSDWIAKLDAILSLNGRELLTHAGKISHELAEEISAKQLIDFRERLKVEERQASLDELERDLAASQDDEKDSTE